MEVKITLNGKMIKDTVDADMLLIDFCRKHKCYSVKRGCETGNCGLCTVLMDGKPMLSCSIPVGRADGRCVDTLEGLEEEAKKFTGYFAMQGAHQCGFCNPGYIVNIVALLRENPDPTDEEILEYLSGNLCRCTGYQSQLRSLRNYLNSKKENAPMQLEAEVFGADIGKEWKNECTMYYILWDGMHLVFLLKTMLSRIKFIQKRLLRRMLQDLKSSFIHSVILLTGTER